MKDKLFFILSGGLVCGILFSSFLDFGWSAVLFIFLIAITLLGFAFVVGQENKFVWIVTALFLVASSLGFARYQLSEPSQSQVLDSRIDGEVSITGVISNEPDVREKNQRLEVSFDDGSKALIVTELFPEYTYGDAISIVGEVVHPTDSLVGEDGRVFDYASYLAKDGISYEFFYPKIEVVGYSQGSTLKRILFGIKHSFLENLSLVIPEPESALAGGLVVGGKQSLGAEWLEAFRRAGVTHIVVLSGFNLMIVATWLMWAFSFLPKKWNWGIGIVGIILFTVMTGAGAATVRAAIMAIIATVARGAGRTYTASRALLIAGIIMIMLNPRILVFDTGFQLSILATLGLIFLAPVLEPKLLFIKWKWLREVAVTTISAQIAVAPWILYVMGSFSIVALPVNLLVLPLIPWTMLGAFITGLVGFGSMAISIPFGWVSYLLLHLELFIVKVFAQLPFASVSVGYFPVVIVFIIYLVYLYLIFKNRNSETLEKAN